MCVRATPKVLEKAFGTVLAKVLEKAHAKVADRLRAAQKDYGEKYDKYAEQQVKQGKPRPTTAMPKRRRCSTS